MFRPNLWIDQHLEGAMALKDLVANKAALTEEAIETIIADYVRYDADAGEILLTPAGMKLRNKPKVLVYLIAILGWPYVTREPPEVGTRPADLEEMLGIPGGTLRPLLRELNDGRLVQSSGGTYSVRIVNLDAIRDVVSGGAKSKVVNRKSKAKATPDRAKRTEKTKPTGDLRGTLKTVVDEGFLNDPRTLSDVHKRYHELGIIVKMTSLSGPLLDAVRENLLVRNKKKTNGREIWVYRTAKRGGTAG